MTIEEKMRLIEAKTLANIASKDSLINQLKCTGEDQSELQKLMLILTDTDNSTDIAIMSHWIWTVKRQLMSMEAGYRMIPILHAKKNEDTIAAINNLIKPLSNYRLDLKLRKVKNKDNIPKLSTHHVLLFDEIQTKADVNVLKSVATQNWIHSLKIGEMEQSCSFIGATSNPISKEMAKGFTKFWEIKTQSRVDWDALCKIDYIKIWQGIDENKEWGYMGTHIDAVIEAHEARK